MASWVRWFAVLLCLPAWDGARGEARQAAEGIIKLDVVVTDGEGKPQAGLSSPDFVLTDNGQPGKILSFQAFGGGKAEPDPPVEVVLVMDSVNLTKSQAAAAERGLDELLRQNGGHLAQPVTVYRLLYGGLVSTAKPSVDGNALAEELKHPESLRVAFRGLNEYQIENEVVFRDAASRNALSLNALGNILLEERRKPGRKLVIWIGYGWPTGNGGEESFERITEYSTRLREARVTLSSVTGWANPDRGFYFKDFLSGVKAKGQATPVAMALPVMAVQSGGRVVETAGDLAAAIGDCMEDANAFYTISFDPPRADMPDEYHDLEVKVGKPGFAARTNMGYYNQPVFYDLPAAVPEAVTVSQLDAILGGLKGLPDDEVTRRLGGFELTERVPGAELPGWKERLPGPRSWSAMVALTDAALFKMPAAAEIPSEAIPDGAGQRQILAKTVDYLGKLIPKLPDLYATRTSDRYEEPVQKKEHTWKMATGDHGLRMAGSTRVMVLYRDGSDVEYSGPDKQKKPAKVERTMSTKGTFGPILFTVIKDAARSDLKWSHWEKRDEGRMAVFRFSVPKEKSHYEVSFCCLTDMNGALPFQQLSGYHGELGVDPETGAVLRLAVQADLEPNLPLNRADIVVEYAPVTIAEKTYICAERSVAISRGRTVTVLHEWGGELRTFGPFETMLNHVVFGDYHIFRSDAKILGEDSEAEDGKSAGHGPG